MTYEKPQVQRFGTFRDLTQSGTVNASGRRWFGISPVVTALVGGRQRPPTLAEQGDAHLQCVRRDARF